jgi:hypothetical protein
MAKESGIGFSVTLDDSSGAGQDISNDVTNLSLNTTQGMQDITGLDSTAIERLGLLRDGEVALSGVFNDAAGQSHAVLKDYYATTGGARTMALAVSGQTLSMEMLIENYNLTRGTDGSLTWTATARLQSGTTPTWS